MSGNIFRVVVKQDITHAMQAYNTVKKTDIKLAVLIFPLRSSLVLQMSGN